MATAVPGLRLGDLNIGTQYTDPTDGTTHRWGASHRATIARFEALGFVECLGAGVTADCPRSPHRLCLRPRARLPQVCMFRYDDKPRGTPAHRDAADGATLMLGPESSVHPSAIRV